MMTDENGQGVLFDGTRDAPVDPIGKPFLSAVGKTLAAAGEAMRERQRLDAIEAEEAAEEAARLAHIAEAAETLGNLTIEAEPDHEPPPSQEPASNVIPIRRKRVPKGDGRGDFFAVDQRLWDRVCALGLNPAVAYLVIARGTGGDNLTSSWSVNAIETHAGMGRIRAKAAVSALVAGGLIHRVRAGSAPRYMIATFNEVAAAGKHVKGELGNEYLAVLQRIEAHGDSDDEFKIPASRGVEFGWQSPNPKRLAGELHVAGYLQTRHGAGDYRLTDAGRRALVPRWVWLPNAIVDGAANEPSPLERIRQSQFLPALRLFIDMYHEQEVSEVAGVNWRHGVREDFTKHKVGARGLYVVWGFKPKNDVTWRDARLARPHLKPPPN